MRPCDNVWMNLLMSGVALRELNARVVDRERWLIADRPGKDRPDARPPDGRVGPDDVAGVSRSLV